MSQLLLDLRQAARVLRRRPLVPLVAMVSLGGAIAANTIAFGFLEAYVLRPLPFHEPERLAHVWSVGRQGAMRASVPDVLDWRERTRAFEDLAVFNYTEENLTGGEFPERVAGARVSANALGLLGGAPILGRDFLPGEDAAGAQPVAVLREAFWRARYGGAPDVLGRALQVDGVDHTIVGVVSDAIVFPLPVTGFYLPRVLEGGEYERDQRFVQVFGRLRDGVTWAQAQADVERVAAELAALHPATNEAVGAELEPLREALDFAEEVVAPMMSVLMAAAFLLFLLACANVANLYLAQAARRDREFSVRSALGAGRGRILRHRLLEAGIVAALSAGVGVGLALLASRGLAGLIPPDLYHVGTIRPGINAVLLSLGLAGVAALGLGVAPGWRRLDSGLMERLRRGAAGAGGARAGTRLQNLLVGAEVAGAVVILVASALLVRSLQNLRGADPGFESGPVLTLKLQLPATRYASPEAIADFHDRLTRAAAGLPGVEAAATVNFLPLNFEYQTLELAVDAGVPAGEGVTGLRVVASPEYFRALGVRLLRGRAFGEGDGAAAERVAVVDRRLAERLWPGEEALDRSLYVGDARRPARVVGVVEATRQDRLDDGATPAFFEPAAQGAWSYFRLLVRVRGGEPAALAGPARALVRELDPALAVTEVRPLGAVVADFGLAQRRGAQVLGFLGLVSLALATLGVFGVVAFSVSRRVREIAIRRALGADDARVRAMLMRGTVATAGAGLLVGLAGAAGLSRFLESLLYGVRALDPVSFLAPGGLLAAVAALAGGAATRRVSGIEPMHALREEGS